MVIRVVGVRLVVLGRAYPRGVGVKLSSGCTSINRRAVRCGRITDWLGLVSLVERLMYVFMALCSAVICRWPACIAAYYYILLDL